ncbi:hypothetical protein JAAARDRAFT_81428 [Jaapia argillacea MUCL 33604]|uniref:Uncharacterized protein n=1 Tax=Jaapia argillacea MUCL 33604 TaxID=933084 RepID=A0A067PCA5_9AGAM|nr:hypothetical protein JAAARDRAFT_81428 [Jaapia argillacea MUCL 33604]
MSRETVDVGRGGDEPPRALSVGTYRIWKVRSSITHWILAGSCIQQSVAVIYIRKNWLAFNKMMTTVSGWQWCGRLLQLVSLPAQVTMDDSRAPWIHRRCVSGSLVASATACCQRWRCASYTALVIAMSGVPTELVPILSTVVINFVRKYWDTLSLALPDFLYDPITTSGLGLQVARSPPHSASSEISESAMEVPVIDVNAGPSSGVGTSDNVRNSIPCIEDSSRRSHLFGQIVLQAQSIEACLVSSAVPGEVLHVLNAPLVGIKYYSGIWNNHPTELLRPTDHLDFAIRSVGIGAIGARDIFTVFDLSSSATSYGWWAG